MPLLLAGVWFCAAPLAAQRAAGAAAGSRDSADVAALLAERLVAAAPPPKPGSPAVAIERTFVAGLRQPHLPDPPREFERYLATALHERHVTTVALTPGTYLSRPPAADTYTLGVRWAVISAAIAADSARVRATTTIEYVPRPSTFSTRDVEYAFVRRSGTWRLVREKERSIQDGILARPRSE